ncbi:UDP-N-acetylmuramate--L-alanine ligase [Aureispira anguillae]|uniref:UDP-N-acetylmuramate--L-alanine ligase n=1 Tax=Aureispira anguillae TaxID=2864201 RepID=A0A916DUN2_9BACT|nr:UDP-N-acetylmuramate--L-alanine ligase [Aureispira anguillae]BDS12852.1 UDP-N-acetylmuramate--L-alanine ligase [Aureispira anguillae]
MKLDGLKKIYFVGIGGIGMSALARYFNSLGIEIFGYDKVETVLTKTLEQEGMKIHYEDNVSLIPNGIDLVVYTPAIPKTHQELTYFLEQGYPVKKRAEVLGIVSRNRKTIGVAGTHGKTTTSAILTHLLRTCGIDCTAFLGGIAENFNSNFVAGKSDWVVMEADEFDRSFLQLNPELAIVTSMDADHLDIYGNKEAMHQTFFDYVNQVNHTVYYKYDLPLKDRKKDHLQLENYGIEEGGIRATNIRAEAPYFIFDWEGMGTVLKNLKFSLPGHHNVLNATAAIAVAKQLNCEEDKIREALLSFKGIKRRFEFKYTSANQVYIDDYAHHPEELKAAIGAARNLYPDRQITAVFQPHLYSRTKDFAQEFAAALDALDEVILLDIYPARELPIEGVTSAIIFDKMQNKNKVLQKKETLLETLAAKEIEVLMTLGAGDIGVLVPDIVKILAKN